MTRLPDDLFARAEHRRFAPSARREIELLGNVVELLWLPERRTRAGVPGAQRPPFLADPAPRIVAEEAIWSDDALAATPNRYPFAARQVVLWSTRPGREPDAAMLAAAFEFTATAGASALMNSIGAAASIARAHLHLVADRLPFLENLATDAVQAGWTAELDAVTVTKASPPFPVCLLRLDGAPLARAGALARLLELRTATAFNAVDDGRATWLMPRSAIEVTAPWFPQALGAAELWGRWCFLDEAAFRSADAHALLAALDRAGFPNRDP